MKKLTLFAAIAAIFLIQNVSGQTHKHGAEYCSQRKSRMNIVAQDNPFSLNSPKHKFDVLNYSLDLDIFNCFTGSYPNNFTGSVIVTFRIDTALNSINLDAYSASLVIDSVSMNAVSFTHTNDVLNLVLDQQYQPGQTAQVKIYYHHLNVTDNAYYASGGFVFTDCEPDKARRWFPCYDHPSDKATTEMFARVPLNVKMASNGRLQDSVTSGSARIYHWISAQPVATYLIIITAKVNYNLDIVYWTNPFIPGATPTPMRFYFNDGEDPTPMEQLIGPLATYFSDHYGNHPFEKNGFATLNNQFSWGGMENQTLTSLCPGCWYESLIVHEFAHQWFGDAVTCATWADIFLNEGFATWSEAFWYENTGGYTAYKSDIYSNADSYLNGNPGWPIVNPSWAFNPPNSNQLFNYAITYAKGACVLHQLRYVMGDSAFFAGLKNYATDTNNLLKSAVVADLQIKMEQASGQSLDWYFNEWLMEPNHPNYANSYNIMNMGGNSWRVRFFAKQTQTNTVFFVMPIELRIRFADGTDTIVRVMNDVNNQLFEFYFNKQVTQVSFDPNNDIVLKTASLIVGIEDPDYSPSQWILGQSVPNPANDYCVIPFDVPQTTNLQLLVSDLSGKIVFMTDAETYPKGTHEYRLQTDMLANGSYLYTLKAGEQKFTRKLIISR